MIAVENKKNPARPVAAPCRTSPFGGGQIQIQLRAAGVFRAGRLGVVARVFDLVEVVLRHVAGDVDPSKHDASKLVSAGLTSDTARFSASISWYTSASAVISRQTSSLVRP